MESDANNRHRDARRVLEELQAPLSGLMAFLVGSTLAVNQMEFRLCRLSAKRGYYGRATLIHH